MPYHSLLIYASALVISTIVLETVPPRPDFRSTKNITFSSAGGGSSHHVWVLEILKEMHHRGHQAALYSRVKYLASTDDITKQVDGAFDFIKHSNIDILINSHPDQIELGMFAVQASMINHTLNFYEYQVLFEQKQIGLVICDSFAINCIGAAAVSELPVMITSTMSLYAEIRKLSKKAKPAFDLQRKLDLSYVYDTSSSRYNAVPKLASSLYGAKLACSLSPLFHMEEPVMQSTYPALNQATAAF
ncbi:uncharacterized protein B0P05DRAFT_590211 [Gilbertella persicaria]|uniref:uncharacterized protein n=1 Tax=Gilbertella persicaria TaxID=101096 RepID=UPI0022212AB3|nr:uncharacterized protein B0P05DRAFT_590211 [Gilbertella persicaria]KAI8063679.1 hypothetical protein B0P05DRAFT_590211 [Gilbertella persicaria]